MPSTPPRQRLGPRLLVLIALALAAASFAYFQSDAPTDAPTKPPVRPIPAQKIGRYSFLALGDSYTIGESVPAAERWPMQLAAQLRAEGLDLSDPVILARTGWTTAELAKSITENPLPNHYDLVTLLIGVNNQYRGRPLEEYRAEFSALLRRAIAFARGRPQRVVVLSIPDWGVTPFAVQKGRDAALIGRELDAFNAATREIAQAAGVAFVDITPFSREPGRAANFLAPDGLHPSGAQYLAWARLAAPECANALRGE